MEKISRDLHDGSTGGHFAGNTIADKVMRDGFYWPTLYKDAHSYECRCLVCQICAEKKLKVSNLDTACCSGRTIPTVGLGYHWGDFPTFIKVALLYFYFHRLLHTMERISYVETSELSGSHQLPTAEHHLQVWHSYITCFLQCNILFFVNVIAPNLTLDVFLCCIYGLGQPLLPYLVQILKNSVLLHIRDISLS